MPRLRRRKRGQSGLTPAEARAELARRDAAALAGAKRRRTAEDEKRAAAWSIEAAAAGHLRQVAMARDQSRHIIAMCSRRAGKSRGVCMWLLDGALNRPDSDSMYIALTAGQAGLTVWSRIWKPLLREWGIRCHHNNTDQITTFPNGARVIFAGTDDVAHIQSYLGSKLWRVAVDECQSQSDTVLEPLIMTILPPALSDDGGQLLMSGTIPEVPAGVFYKIWSEGGDAWSRHSWSRFDNPHMLEQRLRLEQHLAAHPGLTEDHPTIQRDWKGIVIFDANATGYQYLQSLNGYQPEVPPWLAELRATLLDAKVPIATLLAAVPWSGIDTFTVGIDPGSVDRVALVVWGWGPGRPEVQQVFEWVTPRKAHVSWSQIAQVGAVVQRQFAPIRWYYDAGSSKNELDTFQRDYGIPVIKAANKSDTPGQIRKTNDLLTSGRAKVIMGSGLEEDYTRARPDPAARARGIWRWSGWHPDPSEAARYALQGYFELYKPSAPAKSLAERMAEEERERLRQLYAQSAPGARPWFDKDAAALGLGPGGPRR